MALLVKLIQSEFKAQRGLMLLLFINAFLGLLGFGVIESVRNSVEMALSSNSQKLLGADISVGGRRKLSDGEIKEAQSILGSNETDIAQIHEVYSMSLYKDLTRLVQLRATSSEFPFYGEFLLENQPSTGIKSLELGTVWIYPELSAQLGIQAGEEIKIGDRVFRVSAVLKEDVGALWASFSMAPRVYMRLEDLKTTGLIREGSLVTYQYLFKVTDALNAESLKSRMDALQVKLNDSAVRVTSHVAAAQQSARFLAYFNDYLGLIAVMALVLSSLGTLFLFRSFLQARLREVAVLAALGLPMLGGSFVYVVMVLLVGVFSAACVWFLMPFLFAAVLPELKSSLTLDVSFVSSPETFLQLCILGTLGILLIILPTLSRLKRINPQFLFQEAVGLNLETTKRDLIWFLPALIYYYILSVWVSHSIKNGSIFYLGVLGTLIIFWLTGGALLRFLSKKIKVKDIGITLAIRDLSRSQVSTLFAFLALGLGAMILGLLPQLKNSLETEITSPEVSKVPSLFLFDIQEEQLEGVQKLVASFNVKLDAVSPLIRARLMKINNSELEKASIGADRFFREDEQSDRSRNRTFNLSYRSHISESEEIIEGRDFTNIPLEQRKDNEPAEVSVEERFAERLALKIGDLLTFDIQGVEMVGRIVSLRRVKWTSFQPNFFVQFQSGALEDAPKTFLASIPKVPIEERAKIQNQLTKSFSNVSIVDVTRIMQKLLQVIETVARVLQGMAILCLISGFVVLLSIAIQQSRSKAYEMSLLKTLGVSKNRVSGVFGIEYGLIGLGASLLGAVAGLLVSFFLAKYVFDGIWSPDFKSLFILVFLLSAISALAGIWSSGQVYSREKVF